MHTNAVTHVSRALVSLALVAAALVISTPSGADAAAVPCQRTFTNATSTPISASTLLPFPPFLPLPGVGASSITATAGTVLDVDVTVNITHASADLLTLVVGHGDNVVVKSPGLSPGANFEGTTFDDEAAQPVSAGAPPYHGRYQPGQPLTAYDGDAAAGTWSLTVTNTAFVVGTIDSWSVAITYAGTCDFDADGVEDHIDKCVGLTGSTASGCPIASRSLTAKYKRGSFRGVLASNVSGCKAGRAVTVWKVRSGPDRKIGTRTSRADGSYRLKHAKRKGRYYATSRRVVLTGVAVCPAVRSPRFRIS